MAYSVGMSLSVCDQMVVMSVHGSLFLGWTKRDIVRSCDTWSSDSE